MKKTLLVFQLIIATYSVFSMADEEGAKDIFFLQPSKAEPSAKPNTEKHTKHLRYKIKNKTNKANSPVVQKYSGMKYWIELQRGDKLMRVSPGYLFQSGDRFKIGVITKQDGYLYLSNTGTTGQSHILYPPPNSNDDGFVKAGTVYILPLKGMMEFDNNPGEELFKLALSSKPLANGHNTQTLSNNSTNDATQVAYAHSSSCNGSKDILLDDACEQNGSKDILVEEDQKGDLKELSHPATYVVAPVSFMQEGNTIIRTLKLKHE